MRLRNLAALPLLVVAGALNEQEVLRVGMDMRSPPWSFVPGLDYSREDQSQDPQLSEAQLRKVTGIEVEVAWFDLAPMKIGAIRYDSPYVHRRVSRDKTFRTVGEPLNRLGCYVGLRREDAALIAKLKNALNELTVSGEHERIRKKWETPQ